MGHTPTYTSLVSQDSQAALVPAHSLLLYEDEVSEWLRREEVAEALTDFAVAVVQVRKEY